MSRVYDAVGEADASRGRAGEARSPDTSARETPPAGPGLPAPEPGWRRVLQRTVGRRAAPPGGSDVSLAREFFEQMASLEIAIDALDDRVSEEIGGRDAKLAEALRHDLRALETELSERFAAAVDALGRRVRLALWALALGQLVLVVLLALLLAR